jgi:hypothetical protein
MYRKLFQAVTKSILDLQAAQVETEAMYINHEPPGLTLLNPDEHDGDE